MFKDNILMEQKEIVDIQPLIRMKALLEKALDRVVQDELDEMAAVQAFEVSYELAWKTLQKILNQQGAQARNPRETFRLAAQWGYLEDSEVWLNFGKERNLASHTYQEDILTAIYNLLPKFLQELNKLIKRLQEEKP